MRKMIFLFILVIPVLVFGQEQKSMDQNMELMRSNLRADKVQIITKAMNFDPAEAAVFWPVYNEYQKEVQTIGDERLALIKDYAEHFNTDQVTDEKANEWTQKSLAIDEKRLSLLKSYVPKFQKVLSARRVARLLQVENQINRMIDIQVASEIPLVP